VFLSYEKNNYKKSALAIVGVLVAGMWTALAQLLLGMAAPPPAPRWPPLFGSNSVIDASEGKPFPSYQKRAVA
jgi:hypothetical protein